MMTESSSTSEPDLELRVFIESDNSLSYELRRRDPGGERRLQEFRSPRLRERLEEYLGELWRDLEGIYDEAGDDGDFAERRLRAKGAALAEAILPPDLRAVLEQEGSAPRSLLIISDEPRIPWEVAWISRQDETSPAAGFFLGETFAIGRWWLDRKEVLALPFREVALVVDTYSELPQAEEERNVVLGLATRERRAVEIPPEAREVLDELARGGRDAWHFVGHGSARARDAQSWALGLSDGNLRVEDVLELDGSAGKPFVFFNSCASGRMGLSLSATGGWPERFVRLGAGAFLGPQWAVRDRAASGFARLFYERFRQGLPIGEAVRRARTELTAKDRAARLSYALYASPQARCASAQGSGDRMPRPCRTGGLEIPERPWRSGVETTAALLLAEHAIAPLLGREEDLADLEAWCAAADQPFAVRLYTGPGGMGKTRLAIALCGCLWSLGWNAGFAPREAERDPAAWIRMLGLGRKATMIVVDYAASRRATIAAVVEAARQRATGAFRLLLLDRDAWEWWDRLLEVPGEVGAILGGPATERRALQPAAHTVEDRQESLGAAMSAFAGLLRQQSPSIPLLDFGDRLFDRVLMLHMAGLATLLGGGEVTSQDGILDFLLARERRDWERRARTRRIEPAVAAGIGRAMAAISLAGGARNEAHAIAILRGLDFFADERAPVLANVVRLLREAYPGESWIEPLQPDTLGDRLAWKEMMAAGPGSDLEKLFFARGERER